MRGDGMAFGPVASAADVSLRPGTSVEVWCTYTAGWVGGYLLAELGDEGWMIRRSSDGELLPVPLPLVDVRVSR